MKKNGFYGYVYDFSEDYGDINISCITFTNICINVWIH